MPKTIKIAIRGEAPQYAKSLVSKYDGKPATRDNLFNLDSDITFCVCDLKEAHGNFNQHSRSAWLCPVNGDNSFNINFEF